MNIFKKILSFFVLLIILNSNILNVGAISNTDYKSLILSKNSLEETMKWRKYMGQIDEIIDSYKDNRDVLEKLEIKLAVLFEKLKFDTSTKNKDMKNIINYFYLKTIVALDALEDTEEEILFIEEIEEFIEEEPISDEEKKMIDEKLVEIQLNLLNWVENKLEKILDELEETTNYEENWNLDMNFSYSYKDEWDVNASFNLSNYTSKKSNFDSQFSWEVDLDYEANIEWEKSTLSLSTILDLISKDWDLYVLLEDLNISQENLDYLDTQIEKIKEVALDNKYIKYSDEEANQLITMFNSITLSNIISQWETILSQAMFEAYRKEGDKYYIQPTLYACSEAKKLMNKFDPFYWDICSQNQYEDMLEEMKEVWTLYIILWDDDTTLGFEWSSKSDFDEIEGYVIFSDTQIEEIYFSVIPNQEYYPWEYLELEYVKNEKLNFVFYADEGSIDYSFVSELNNDNDFIYIDYSWKTLGWYEEFTSNFGLKDHKMTWSFELITYWYDYNTRTKYLDKAITWNITWKTSYSNKLSEIDIEYIWDDSETWKFLNWNFSYYNWVSSLNNYFYNEWLKSDFELNLVWDKDDKIFTDGSILFDVFSKQWERDYETWEYIYTWDFEKTFDFNLDIEDKKFDWILNVYNEWENLFSSSFDWKYDKKYFELNDNFELAENDNMLYFYWIDNFISWSLNILINNQNENKNLNIIFETYLWEDKIIDFELNNKGDRTYKDIEINVPDESDVIEFEEIIEDFYY